MIEVVPYDLIWASQFNVLDQHQNKRDKRYITVGLYPTKVPTNCHLPSEYYLSHCT
jgi:hypothetical protein